MAKDPNVPETNPWLVPFEAGRQWMELAAKAQTVLSQQLKQDKIPAPFSQEVVAGAFSQLFAGLLSDPAKMARAQQDLWQGHAALWQDLMTKNFKGAEEQGGRSKDRRFRHEEWDKNIAFNVLKHNYLIGA